MNTHVSPPNFERSNDVQQVDVAIIGCGFGGLCMAIKLLEEGNQSFVVLEKGNEVGCTWRDNSYPGAACDVQSHLYSYSFAPKPDWSQRFANAGEIHQYIIDTADKYRVRPFVRFNREVLGTRFDMNTGCWTLNTSQGETIQARNVVMASGPLHVPAIPKIKGAENFQGTSFHSAQWNHDYDLTGKNVVSIGTGASAVQYAPEIAPKVKQLFMLQRTANWLIPRDERKYSARRKKLFANFPILRKLHRARLYWGNELRVVPVFNPLFARQVQRLAKMFIKYQVDRPSLAKQLTPDYTMGCKRILISNKYFRMFNRDNVELISQGIEEIRENSVVMKDGRELPADCIVYGTGFQVDPRLYMKEFECSGLPGRELMDDWKGGAEAYYGVSVTGYPNLYQLCGPNTLLGHSSMVFMLEAQVNLVLDAMREMKKRGAQYMDVSPQAQKTFNEEVQEGLKGTVWTSGCVSWYQQADGKNFTLWPWTTTRFWLKTRKLKTQDFRFFHCPAMLENASVPVAKEAV